MKRWLAAVVIGLGVLGWHGAAHAACMSHTYILGGRITICTTCCYWGHCTTNCT